jgi:hypothetical protein
MSCQPVFGVVLFLWLKMELCTSLKTATVHRLMCDMMDVTSYGMHPRLKSTTDEPTHKNFLMQYSR